MKILSIFNKRVLILIISGLLLLDLFIGFFIDRRFAEPENCRLPSDDIATIRLWIDQVEKSEGFKVVFLGDSVVHGLAAGDGGKSLPARLASFLKIKFPGRDIKVFNLALEGSGPAETFLILNALGKAKIDLVIYDLNIAWFPRQKTLDHPNLLALSSRYPEHFNPREMSIKFPERHEPVNGEDFITETLLNRWKLYRYRILLNYWLFGKPIRNKLPLAVHNPGIMLTNREDAYPEIKKMRTPWREKDWPVNPDPNRPRLGRFNLSPENTQWKFYLSIIDLLKERGIEAVFFTPPRNFELLEKTGSIDYPKYRYNSELAEKAANDNEITVLRFDYALDNKYFTDIIHPTAFGNTILAEKMASEMIARGLLKE